VQTRFKDDNIFRLERFDLSGVECVYGVDGSEGELWPVKIVVGSQSDIIFREDDPHRRFGAFITGWYNASGGDIGVFAEVCFNSIAVLTVVDSPRHLAVVP
jgi:hypothetical protein